ncbi:helix-turn-helix domain-containing protein [Methylosinus sp. R-45379]|uniref:helix-turn-helix domain-containing protein n=1 Tax=Methylosinus sp. R-45379 TaxID=980563 RepID=UPI000AC6A61B
MLRFNADRLEGLVDRKALGQPSRLDAVHRAALAALIEEGPTPAIHGVVRWRIVDQCQWTFEEFRVVVSEQTIRVSVIRKGLFRPKSGRRATRRWRGRSFCA